MRRSLVHAVPSEVISACDRVLAVKASDFDARVQKLRALSLRGSTDAAEVELNWLKKHKAPRVFLAQAEEAYADGLWKSGDLKRSGSIYQKLLSKPLSQGRLRVLEVKALATHTSRKERKLLWTLLVGPRGAGTSPRYAMFSLPRAWKPSF